MHLLPGQALPILLVVLPHIHHQLAAILRHHHPTIGRELPELIAVLVSRSPTSNGVVCLDALITWGFLRLGVSFGGLGFFGGLAVAVVGGDEAVVGVVRRGGAFAAGEWHRGCVRGGGWGLGLSCSETAKRVQWVTRLRLILVWVRSSTAKYQR